MLSDEIEGWMRVTFHDLLLELMFAETAAFRPDGQDQLMNIGAAVTRLMGNMRFPQPTTAEEKSEALLNAKMISERFFASAEKRRAEIVGEIPSRRNN